MACIEDLREKREELNRSLLRDEEEKAKIQKELSTLTERLSRLNEDLARKMQVSDQQWALTRQHWHAALSAHSQVYSHTTPHTHTHAAAPLALTLVHPQARVEFDSTIQVRALTTLSLAHTGASTRAHLFTRLPHTPPLATCRRRRQPTSRSLSPAKPCSLCSSARV